MQVGGIEMLMTVAEKNQHNRNSEASGQHGTAKEKPTAGQTSA